MPKSNLSVIFKFIAKNPAMALICGGILFMLIGGGALLINGGVAAFFIAAGICLLILGIFLHFAWLKSRSGG